MQVLVTGGAGFIGRALANRLVHSGYEVRVIDDLSAGDEKALDKRVLFTRGDVRDVPKLWSQLQDVECVFHLASLVSVPQSILYPSEYNAVNVGGTVAVMEAMRDAGVNRVVLASSGALYGEQDHQPVAETDVPHPDSPYAVSKLAAENYVHTIGALWGIETVCLRIFNCYGPGQQLPASHWPVVPRFFSQILSGGSLVAYGKGSQARDYVYLDDVIDAMVAAATVRSVNQLTVNVGSGVATTVQELIRTVEKVAGRPAHVVSNPQEPGGVSTLCADVSLAREKLDYRPAVDLQTGLKLTLERDPRFARFR